MKLNRGRRSVFRKRNPLPKILGWSLAAVASVAVGLFGAKWLSERPVIDPVPEDLPAATQPADTTTSTTTPLSSPPHCPELCTVPISITTDEWCLILTFT